MPKTTEPPLEPQFRIAVGGKVMPEPIRTQEGALELMGSVGCQHCGLRVVVLDEYGREVAAARLCYRRSSRH
jgi:hypothetical protein